MMSFIICTTSPDIIEMINTYTRDSEK